jgi:hypothetical protein
MGLTPRPPSRNGKGEWQTTNITPAGSPARIMKGTGLGPSSPPSRAGKGPGVRPVARLIVAAIRCYTAAIGRVGAKKIGSGAGG